MCNVLHCPLEDSRAANNLMGKIGVQEFSIRWLQLVSFSSLFSHPHVAHFQISICVPDGVTLHTYVSLHLLDFSFLSFSVDIGGVGA